jgi:hypothetical protein
VSAWPPTALIAMLAAMLIPVNAVADEGAGLEAPGHAMFTETIWPFLLDQWGTGRAFRCDPCGGELALYLRAKVGFCNCATGVADDLEIDRVADFDLFPGRVTPLTPGRPVSVAWMRGRARAFQVDGPAAARRYLLTIALSNKCDGVIATVASKEPISADVAQAALDELASPAGLGWVKASTGLQ